MNLTVITPPATEPLTLAEVMAYARIDATHQEPAPGIITAALAGAGAGNVDNGAHRYLATFTTATGETQAGTVSAAVTVVDKAANGKVALSGIPLGGGQVTGRKLYRTVAGGSTYLLLTTLADNTTTTYTDNTADASLGAGAPSANTTVDPLLSLLIASARAAVETELHRSLITQTLELALDGFPSTRLDELRLPPLSSVTSITYVDTAGATQTWATDQYVVDSRSAPARITLAEACSWPATRRQTNAVVVRFVAGYGAAAAVPQCIKNWMLLRIGTLWENRATLTLDGRNLVAMPTGFVDRLLDSERVMGRIAA